MAVPLFHPLEAKASFCWARECHEAFDKLKSALVTNPIVAFPDFRVQAEPFQLATDALEFGLGAVLSQKQDGEEKVIAYASRSLHKAEKTYSTIEKEALGLVRAVAHFRQYLYGRKFN